MCGPQVRFCERGPGKPGPLLGDPRARSLASTRGREETLLDGRASPPPRSRNRAQGPAGGRGFVEDACSSGISQGVEMGGPPGRRCRRGELVQIDGSYHSWLEERGPKACLLLFVDDATSEILAAEFVDQESFFAYGNLCKSYFSATGTPVAFYSDKFSVFRANSSRSIQKEAVTQFNRALSSLGIALICANSPQAKGRVERANQTFQDRLVKEMRLLNIDNYQHANAFLPKFVNFYNHKFAVLPRSTDDVHVPLDTSIDLDFLFSVHDTRTITKDLLIHFNTLTYQIITTRPPRYLTEREVLVVQNQTGLVSAFLNHQELSLQLFHKQAKPPRIAYSKSLNPHIYTPPVNHPWRSYGQKLNGKPTLINDP